MMEIEAITPERFRAEIVGGDRPVVLRGLVRDWPVVKAGLRRSEERR